MSEVARIALELMQLDSTSGHEQAAVTAMTSLLSARGWSTVRIPVGTDGRACVFASLGEDVDVTLSTHLDTVPPFLPPRLEGDKLWGRGACDAKGIAASMIVAADHLRSQGLRVGLLFVVGEETSHDGARAANTWIRQHLPQRTRILINGEPTESTLGVGTKGAQRLVVRTKGRAAHSAYPSHGHSAITALVEILGDLQRHAWPRDELLGETTLNIGFVSGGVADNVFAPAAEARLMFRLVTDAKAIQTQTLHCINNRAEVEWGVMVPPVRLGVVPGFPTSVAAFATDIPALTNWGTPYLFGPGSIHVAHTDHEHVSVRELELAVDAYIALVRGASQTST